MSDTSQSSGAPISSVAPEPALSVDGNTPLNRDQIDSLANMSNAAFDEVVVQADYCTRSMISFWRFRTLGGGRRPDSDGETDQNDGENWHKRVSSRIGAHYVSDHPEMRLLEFSFIALLVIFESAANAYFFAKESEFGLLGGIFQAMAVSLANVAVSYFIIGYWGLRHARMPWNGWRDWSRLTIKFFGFAAIFVGTVVVLLVNLSAAHYRNILDLRADNLLAPGEPYMSFPHFPVDPEVCAAVLGSEIGQSIGSAAANAMCRPATLYSLDAMVLFALGLAISAIAVFEGQGADASFPGLSKAARNFESSRQDLQFALEDYADEFDEYVERIEPDGDGGGVMTRKLFNAERIELRKSYDARVERYRKLLTTTNEILQEEFDAPEEIVRLIAPKGGV